MTTWLQQYFQPIDGRIYSRSVAIAELLSGNASVTFGSAAVGSKKSMATSNYRAAAVFPRSHNVAVTYVFIFWVAARGI